MDSLHYDLCVIGGGINGAGIARDAAGRGLSVLLVEAQDLAGATSSASSKMIHGGLRYLENFAFGMVAKALKEREILYSNARHIISPLDIVIPEHPERRPYWKLGLGLWLYDRLSGKSSLKPSTSTNFLTDLTGRPLIPRSGYGYVYTDCQVDDTRLVVLNAVDAASRNTKVLTYTECEKLSCENGHWRIGLRDVLNNDRLDVSASMVVNATGPWIGSFLDKVGVGASDPDLPKVRLVKGSHLILPRMFEHKKAYLLQQDDGRVVFVMPYLDDYTLVGTTEENYDDDPRYASISDDEMAYLLEVYNHNFKQQITKSDVLFTYSGVRPLVDDGQKNNSKVTRDYKIYHHKRYEAPMLSVFGGKLTTYRVLAEDVVDRVLRISGREAPSWTAHVPLAGGDVGGNIEAYIAAQGEQYPWLPKDLLLRYVRSYGSRMDYFLHGSSDLSGLGQHLGDGLYTAEVDYLMDYEWATCTGDIIWRRSKLGMSLSDDVIAALDVYIKGRAPEAA